MNLTNFASQAAVAAVDGGRQALAVHRPNIACRLKRTIRPGSTALVPTILYSLSVLRVGLNRSFGPTKPIMAEENIHGYFSGQLPRDIAKPKTTSVSAFQKGLMSGLTFTTGSIFRKSRMNPTASAGL